jgi:dihydropteroate synthase type 2
MFPAARVSPGSPQIVGILNLTEDSFSDGGLFLDPERAVEHGEQLLADGADWLDVGAESSNPAGRRVSAGQEVARLTPVVRHFKARGARVSVDTHKPEVMQAAIELGADMINDVTGLREPAAVELLARHPAVMVVVMHARNAGPRAETASRPYSDLVREIRSYFARRVRDLAAHGVARDRVVLDPGMGYFLGGNPEPSLWVLKNLADLRSLGLPLYISTSRKSFIGAVTGGSPLERGAGTLATELWALHQGASFVRTHDVGQLARAWAMWRAVATMEPEPTIDRGPRTTPV